MTFDRSIECPQCGSRDWHSSRRISVPLIRKCRDCRLSYRVEAITPASTPERTPAELTAIEASRTRLFDRVITKLGAPSPDRFLVDIGAGSGFFVQVASNAGWKAVGIELGQPLVEVARDLGRCVMIGNAQSIPLQTAAASVVTLWDVLDHLDEPQAALAEAARILRPGGVLWLRIRNGAVHEFMRSQRWLPAKLSILHNNLYSPRCLRKTLADAGFEDVHVVISPTSGGDPYASMKGVAARGLQLVKTIWDSVARLVALVSAGSVVVSPSIAAFATRETPPSANV